MRSKISLVVACAVAMVSSSAFALPPLPKYMSEAAKAKPELKGFSDAVDGLKSKCDVCHKPGADKKGKGHGLERFRESVP